MSFFRLWLTGYLHPGRAFEALREKPAPHYGLYGVLMRGLIVGLGVVPAARRHGPAAEHGADPALPAGRDLLLARPVVLPGVRVGQVAAEAAIMHLALRLIRMPSDYDVLLNLSGITALDH